MERLREYLLPEQSSTVASDVDNLFMFINIAGGLLLLGITIALVYFSWKYRRKSKEDVTPVIRHNLALELTWTIIPLILIMIVFAWGFRGYMNLRNAPSDAMEVYVTGLSFGWQFAYTNGVMTGSDLVVPAGRPVKLIMQSRDVIHSFFVPDFRIKQDLLPNRYTTQWFQADNPGTHVIFCTEYCGSGHSAMMGRVVVLPQEEFDTWLATEKAKSEQELPLARLGENVFSQQGCMACHSIDGAAGIGPTMKGLFGATRNFTDGSSAVADESYLRESILVSNARIVAGYPPAMPNYTGVLSDRQVDALVEYIKELN
jgi:cytochrome c oxidase subunit II